MQQVRVPDGEDSRPHGGDSGNPSETVGVFINSISLGTDLPHSLKRNITVPNET